MDENDDEFDMDFDMTDVLAVMEQVESHAITTANHLNSNRDHVNTNNNTRNTTIIDNATADFGDDDEFGDDFDDFDVDALVQAADTVEKQISTTGANQVQSSLSKYYGSSSTTSAPQASSSSSTRPTGIGNSNDLNNTANATAGSSTSRITFGMPEDMVDPTPPPPPPADAKTFHPFDSSSLPTWIYPTNHPIRGYQFNIVRKALFSNTLVSIPTGLGKTFIAAVVMYNYYRWFPNSIMIFMAPTRPLVEQQIKACHAVCGIPQKDTVMMVGTGGKVKRPELWAKGRIFFCTPQVVDNDLSNGTCPSHKVVLLVIDEAHKATGNYAYTNVIEKLGRIHSHFRVLALSATPGSTVEKVQAVVNNLRINTIEVRTEESMDVQEFSFGKRVQTIVIKLNYTSGATGVVPRTAQLFCEQVFQPVLDRLSQRKAIYGATVERCSPFALLTDRKNYQINAKNVPAAVKRLVTVDFLLAETFARAYEGLCVYGVAAFVDTLDRFMQSIRTSIDEGKNVPSENYKILNHFGLKQLLDQLRPQMTTAGFIGHPKLESLLNIILRHFNEASGDQQQPNDDLTAASSSTRIIVFSSLRASVNMIVDFLSVHHPLIKCAAFVGQAGDTQGAKGMSQKEQQQTIERFKKGDVNVMVATCIGEEGLDIGEVDLIVCYDSQSSSIRLLQRMGRTGRRRKGHCVMLMTEQEERKFKKATESYKFIQNSITKRNVIECCEEAPSLLPASYQPVVQRKRLVIGNYLTTMVQGMKRKRQGGHTADFQKDGTLTNQGLEAFLATLPEGTSSSLDQAYDRFWPLFHPLKGALKYLSLQTQQNRTKRVGRSRRTVQFTSLMKKMEYRILKGPDDGGGGTVQLSQDTDVGNNQILKLPQRRKPTANTTTRNNSSPSDDYDGYTRTNLASSSSSSKLVLPTLRNVRALLMNDIEESDSKQDSDAMEDVLDESDGNDWSSFMEPLMAKGMADDEDNYYQDHQSDYYQDDQDDYESTADNESPMGKTATITTTTTAISLHSDNSIDGDNDNNGAKRVLDNEKPPVAPMEDDFDDDFDDMGLNFWDDLEKQALKTGQQQNNRQGSTLSPPSGFLFDDDLPPLVSADEENTDSIPAHSSTNFSTSFVWATSKPVFSEQARQILIKRLQISNNRYLSVRLLGDQGESGKSAKSIVTSNSPTIMVTSNSPLPSKSHGSYEFYDYSDVDISKLDDVLGPITETTTTTQLQCVDSATSEQHEMGNNNNNNNIKIEMDLGMDNAASTSSIEWSITGSQAAPYEIEASPTPTPIPQLNIVNNEMTTEQEVSVNNHQNSNDIPIKKSPSFSNIQVDAMDCDSDGGSMGSFEITDDVLDNASIHATSTTAIAPLEKGKNHVESPIPVISTTPIAMEMSSGHLMHSTPQEQQLQQHHFGRKGDFGSRSQYLYSPINNNSNSNRSPSQLISPQNESSINIIGTPAPMSLDGDDSHDTPVVRRKRSRRAPIIRDSEDDDSQNLPNHRHQDDSTHNPVMQSLTIENEQHPLIMTTISSDDEEFADGDPGHKNPTNHQPRPQHRRPKLWVTNPFLDNEAERSDDGVNTGDEDEVDGSSNVMDSFIYDGSSELAPDGDSGGNSLMMATQDSSHHGKVNKGKERVVSDGNDMAMYRTSLLQRDVTTQAGDSSPPPVFASDFRRKTWLDKMETKKWEYVADDDEEEEEVDDQVYHDASDVYSDAFLDVPTGTDGGVSEDISRYTNASDDFM